VWNTSLKSRNALKEQEISLLSWTNSCTPQLS